MFLLVLVGLDPLLVGLPPGLGAVAARIGVLSHFESLGRGVIDLRDVDLLRLAGRRLPRAGLRRAAGTQARPRRRRPPAPARRGNARGVAGRGEPARQLHRRPARPDAGQRVYALSRPPAAWSAISTTSSPSSSSRRKELPTEVALMKRDVDDLLRDLRSAGRGQVRIVERDPSDDEAARREARVARHPAGPVQRDRPGGAAGEAGLPRPRGAARRRDRDHPLRAADRRSGVPAGLDHPATEPRQEAGDRLRGRRAGVRGRRSSEMQEQLRRLLRRARHRAERFHPAGPRRRGAGAGGHARQPAARPAPRLEAFLNRGGSALVLAAGMEVSQRAPTAQPRPVAWNALLRPLGVHDPERHGVRPAGQRGDSRCRPTSAGCCRSIPSSSGRRAPGLSTGESGPGRGGAHLGQHHRHHRGGARAR